MIFQEEGKLVLLYSYSEDGEIYRIYRTIFAGKLFLFVLATFHPVSSPSIFSISLELEQNTRWRFFLSLSFSDSLHPNRGGDNKTLLTCSPATRGTRVFIFSFFFFFLSLFLSLSDCLLRRITSPAGLGSPSE